MPATFPSTKKYRYAVETEITNVAKTVVVLNIPAKFFKYLLPHNPEITKERNGSSKININGDIR